LECLPIVNGLSTGVQPKT